MKAIGPQGVSGWGIVDAQGMPQGWFPYQTTAFMVASCHEGWRVVAASLFGTIVFDEKPREFGETRK